MSVHEMMHRDEDNHDSSAVEPGTRWSPNPAQMAAVVEAAYILEAVRK